MEYACYTQMQVLKLLVLSEICQSSFCFLRCVPLQHLCCCRAATSDIFFIWALVILACNVEFNEKIRKLWTNKDSCDENNNTNNNNNNNNMVLLFCSPELSQCHNKSTKWQKSVWWCKLEVSRHQSVINCLQSLIRDWHIWKNKLVQCWLYVRFNGLC